MKEIVIVFAPFLVSIILIPLTIFLSKKFKILDYPGDRKVHKISKPLLGGLGITIGFFVGILLMNKFGLINFTRKYHIFMIGLGIMFFVGLLDDIFNLKPWIKLFAQIGAAVLFVSLGEISTVHLPFRIIAYIITFGWIIGITNSFNLLDNMDGLSSGISIICAGIFALLYMQTKQYELMFLCLIFLSAQFGFLLFNFYPSKIFMGDTGSLFTGYFFATISIMGSYVEFSRLSRLPVLIPVLVLTVPIFDTVSVIFIRLRKGVSIFKGDKNHFSHRLVELGMSHKQAVVFIYIVTFGTAVSAMFLPSVNLLQAGLLFLQIIIFLLIIITLMIVGKNSNQNNGE